MEFWHNPRCSKSRQALALLRERGVEPDVRAYLDAPPTADELRRLVAALDLASAHDLMRTGEAEYKERALSASLDEETLIAAMAEAPRLIERPVLIAGARAVIGRPPERVLALI
ncbi:arsenate reductase (glutaredoxin) [Alkalicaulis satelles]|uniref:Arsenate reductase n=1 Tax=Alkalicaulis satelles TaxID=2609175 RepID=A0A5M6ZHK9_9PROT|nr:arsenate reductase (glutaredoxin) [Alkalicaulis satelles]KAA5803780.1 arsenate reductase (glutaredoxin) [Alkalicaulis satelles]